MHIRLAKNPIIVALIFFAIVPISSIAALSIYHTFAAYIHPGYPSDVSTKNAELIDIAVTKKDPTLCSEIEGGINEGELFPATRRLSPGVVADPPGYLERLDEREARRECYKDVHRAGGPIDNQLLAISENGVLQECAHYNRYRILFKEDCSQYDSNGQPQKPYVDLIIYAFILGSVVTGVTVLASRALRKSPRQRLK